MGQKPSKQFRALIIRAGQLGDTVCATSIIEPLRQQYGKEVQLHWVGKTGMGSLFASDPRIQKVYELRSRRAPLLINPPKRKIVFESFFNPYDLAVNLELGGMFNSVMRLVLAKQKIGQPYRYFEEPKETHAVTNLHLIYNSFIDKQYMHYATPSLVGEEKSALDKLFKLATRYVVLVPSNSHNMGANRINHRAWPTAHWRELINGLAQQKLQTVIIGGNSEQQFFRQLEPYPSNVVSLVGRTNLAQLTGVIAHAAVMVTTDTGPAHMAGAVNTPVITIIGPTNHKRTAPYVTNENKVHILSANLPCSPCYHTPRLDRCTDNICMSQVTPEQVLVAIDEISHQAVRTSVVY